MKIEMKAFSVIGITVRTENKPGKADQDIPALWNKFMTEDIKSKLHNKIDESVYCVYTKYDGDHQAPYTTLLGCRVSSLEDIPEGFEGITIPEGSFVKYQAKGNLMEGVVFNEWTKIWSMDLDRKYTADYEVYNHKAQDPTNAEVDIFVSIN